MTWVSTVPSELSPRRHGLTDSGLFLNFHGLAGGCARWGAELWARPPQVVSEGGPFKEREGVTVVSFATVPPSALGMCDVTWQTTEVPAVVLPGRLAREGADEDVAAVG